MYAEMLCLGVYWGRVDAYYCLLLCVLSEIMLKALVSVTSSSQAPNPVPIAPEGVHLVQAHTLAPTGLTMIPAGFPAFSSGYC